MDEDKLNTISIDGDQSDTLVKLLDSVVIYLEGGSELDLQVNFKKSYLVPMLGQTRGTFRATSVKSEQPWVNLWITSWYIPGYLTSLPLCAQPFRLRDLRLFIFFSFFPNKLKPNLVSFFHAPNNKMRRAEICLRCPLKMMSFSQLPAYFVESLGTGIYFFLHSENTFQFICRFWNKRP